MPPRLPIALLVLAALPGLAAAHGGAYVAPPGPGGPKVGIPPGPPAPGGSPLAKPTTNPNGPGGPATAASMLDPGLDRTRWTWWWLFNQAPYLDLKRRIAAGGEGPRTGDYPGFAPAKDAPAERVWSDVVAPLLRVLKEERATDLVSSALIALARVGDDLDEERRGQIADAVRPFVRERNHELSEAAVLALGILGHEPSASLLAELLRDQAPGRALLGQGDVPLRTRAFAAYSLGLLAGASEREDVRRYAVHELAGELEVERGGAVPDLEAACVLALGLVPLPDSSALPAEGEALAPAESRAGQLLFLQGLLADRRRSDLVRAQVPLSLARLGGAPAAPVRAELVALARDELCARLAPMRREPNGVVQSAVVGLGLLADNDADPGDAQARRLLLNIDSDQSDAGARRFARIALARCAARDGAGAPEGLEDARRFLLHDLARGSAEVRTWGALSLGVLERGRLDAGHPLAGGTAFAVREALGAAKAPDEQGAAAVALGLMRDAQAAPVLLAHLRAKGDDEARGYQALALGMVGARASQPELERLVDTSLYRPLLLREAATGLVLLGDRQAVPRLQGLLRDARALASQAALAQAIGRVGDARAYGDLAALMGDASVPAGARAFAAVALGLCADQDPLPWSAPLAADGNHLSAPSTLYDDVGLGVLNLL